MPTETVNRTLTMRTALSMVDFGAADGAPGSLGALLDDIHDNIETVPERRALIQGQVVEGLNVRRDADGVNLLHLVAYTPDDPVAVVPDVGEVAEANLSLLAPPEDFDFLDGELMLLVKGNDVAICRSGLGTTAFPSYVAQLAERAGHDSAGAAFQLMKRADIDKLAIVRREGIKRISMGAVAHSASVSRAQRTSVRQTVLGGVMEEILAILGAEAEVPTDADNLKVEVMLTFDKRRGTVIDQRQLSFLADRMLEEEEEGFMIETSSGKKFRADDIVLSKPVKLPAFGKSVHHLEAWGALRDFYRELSRPV